FFFSLLFVVTVPSTTYIYTLSLHDALPIFEDGSYIRLKTVSFSYSLPKKWIGALSLKNVILSATAQNLHTWTNYSGMDPEVSTQDRKSTRLNSSHVKISYAVFCLKKKKKNK